MRFITIRDLRNKPAQIRQTLTKESEIVLTSKGKPFAIVTATSESVLEKDLAMIRRIRAEEAITSMQRHSLEIGSDKLSLDEINNEISAVRKNRLQAHRQ